MNVKVYGTLNPEALAEVERDFAPGFAHWAANLLAGGIFPDWAWDAALEQGWERLKEDAREVFGDRVKVYSEGRSGGWAVLHGLPDVESWDAIALSRFARFCRFAGMAVKDVPYQAAAIAALNVYLPERERAEAVAASRLSAESQLA